MSNNSSQNMREEILNLVKTEDIIKPTRYLGGEINAIIKPNMPFKFVMCFADMYEVAISNLGLSILYEVITLLNMLLARGCMLLLKILRNF